MFSGLRSARWPSSGIVFCARDSPKFREVRNSFARILWKICVLSTAALSRFLHLNALPTRQTAATKFRGLRNAHWPIACKFCARGAPKFQEFCNSFARFGRKTLRDLDADRALFRWQRTRDLFKSFRDSIRFFRYAC